MHKAFVTKWCETFDRLYDSVGQGPALAMTRDLMEPEDWEQVQAHFPTYQQEKKRDAKFQG